MQITTHFKQLCLFVFLLCSLVGYAEEPVVTYHKKPNGILEVFVHNDTVWVGAYNGLFLYKTDGSFIKVLIGYSDGYGEVQSISMDSDGVKWLATRDGIVQYDGKEWVTYTDTDGLISQYASKIHCDSTGNVWCATNYGISKFDGDNWTNYTEDDGLSHNYIIDITSDGEGNIWCGTGNGVAMFNGSIWEAYDSVGTSEGGNRVRSITVDLQGNVWYANSSDSVFMIDRTNKISISKNAGLEGESVRNLIVDEKGVLWATSSIGVVTYDNDKWLIADTSARSVPDIVIDEKGNKWVYTQVAVQKYGEDEIIKTANDPFFSNGPMRIAVDSSGVKWLPFDWDTSIQLFAYDGSGYVLKKHSLYSDVKSLDFDRKGALWVVTYDGVKKDDGEGWITYDYSNITTLLIDKNDNKLFGSSRGEIYQYDDSVWTTLYESRSIGRINSMAIDEIGSIWLGTNAGVVKYVNPHQTYTFTTKDGLASNSVGKIVVDIDGSIWVGTGNGISRFNGTTWKTYTEGDGLLSNMVYDISIDIDGIKWILTDKGVTKYDGVTFQTILISSELKNNGIIDKNGVKWYFDRYNLISIDDNGAGAFDGFEEAIQGFTFYDENRNGIYDTIERLVSQQMVKVESTKTFLGSFDGKFFVRRPDGNQSIAVFPSENWQCTSDSIIDFTIKNGKADKELYFGLAPIEYKDSLVVDIVGEATRAFFDTRYWLNVENVGTGVEPITVIMFYDSLLTYTSASITPTHITDSTLEWTIEGLTPFEQKQIMVDFKVAGVDHLGDTIQTQLEAKTVSVNQDTVRYTSSLAQIITGSYDPNDKQESVGILDKGYTLFDEELFYTIRFQNTGTDTAFTVKVKDTLSDLLEYETFDLQSTSHDCSYELTKDGFITFTFNDIMLPDSNVNEPASHGYIKYSIEPKDSMPEGTEVLNTAYIYFDYNPAIITNTTVNTYVSELPPDRIYVSTYYDRNQNGLQDEGEGTLPKQYFMVELSGEGVDTLALQSSYMSQSGDYDMTLILPQWWGTTTTETESFSYINGSAGQEIVFGVSPTIDVPEFVVDMSMPETKASTNITSRLHLFNMGVESGATSLSLEYDKLLTYNSASITPSAVTDTSLVWEIAEVGILEELLIDVNFTVADYEYAGGSIDVAISVESELLDHDTSNNSVVLNRTIIASQAEAELAETKGVYDGGFVRMDDVVVYTVSFSNVGTAIVDSIIVIDTLSEYVDPNSVQLHVSSHDCIFEISPDGVATFTMHSIALPTKDDDVQESTGYFTYAVQAQSGIADSTEFSNSVYVYFDANPAIETNSIVNTFISELPVKAIEISAETSLSVVPNPARDYIEFSPCVGEMKYQVIDMLGKLVLEGVTTNGKLDVSSLQSGFYQLSVDGMYASFIIK